MEKYVAKCSLKMFLTEDEVLMGYKDTDQNIFNFVDLCRQWGGYCVVNYNPNMSQ